MTEKQVTVTRNQTITLPTPEQTYAIRHQDWERCTRKLEKMKQQVPRFHLVYSFSFGVAVSSVSALITSYAQPSGNLPSWVFSVYWALFAVGLILGCLFVYVDSVFRGERQSDVKDIIEEMKSIEETFPKTQ